MSGRCRSSPGRVAGAWTAGSAILLLATVVATPAQIRGGPSTPAAARRIATTVGALASYPVFFHVQSVRVRGTLRPDRGALVLAQGAESVLVAGPAVADASPDAAAVVEVTGTFVDVGRVTAGDPRLANVDVARLSEERLGKPWPGVNELALLVADTMSPAEPFPAPSLRALALAPERYVDAQVTVTGRFRGRNLYGDQPDAPGRSRWDFVLQLADASVWVAGLRPQGQGFNLNGDTRVDTGRWLEVSGVVRRERHLVVLEGKSVRLATPPSDPTPAEPVVRVPTSGPRPEVVFSAPTHDETDVPRGSPVRIQFSRDLDPTSIKGHVRVGYLGASTGEGGDRQAPSLPFSVTYNEGARVLEIQFPEPLAAFRTIRVELSDEIAATDGARLVPWSLDFSVGS